MFPEGYHEHRQRGGIEMTGEFMRKKETRVAPVIALSGSIATLVTRERGPLSLGRVASGVDSSPVPRQVA